MPARHGGIWQPGPGACVDTQHPLGQGCVGYWDAGATEHGGYWQDISGQNNHGTLVSFGANSGWRGNQSHWSINFAYESESVSCSTFPAYASNIERTVAMMFETNSGVTRFSIGNRMYLEGGSGYGFVASNVMYGNNATRTSVVCTGTGIAVATCENTNAATGLRIYWGGIELEYASGSDGTGAPNPSSGGMAWGNNGYNRGLFGQLLIWNYALPPEYVAQLTADPYQMLWTPGRRSTWWFTAAAAATPKLPIAILKAYDRRAS